MDKLDLKNSHVHLAATDKDELKEWKVGKKYPVHMILKMESMQHDKDGGMAHMSIHKVIPDKERDEKYGTETVNKAKERMEEKEE